MYRINSWAEESFGSATDFLTSVGMDKSLQNWFICLPLIFSFFLIFLFFVTLPGLPFEKKTVSYGVFVTMQSTLAFWLLILSGATAVLNLNNKYHISTDPYVF